MTTSYPAGLDSYTNPTATDELDDEIGTRTHSEFHADNNDAIEAIQAELGTDPSGSEATVKARIAAAETATANHLADVADAHAASAITNTAAGNLVATTVQAALNELDTEKLATTTAATTYQPLDTDLTAIAALTSAADKVPYSTGAGTWALTDFSAFGRTLVDDADASTARSTLGLVIGTNVQAYDGELAALAGLTSAADALPYFTGAGTAAVTTLTAAARTVLDDTTVGAMLATMGGVAISGTSSGAQVVLQTGTATHVPLVAKGAAAQSGNLQQWQNSGGGVLVSVDSAGSVGIGAGVGATPLAQLHVTAAVGHTGTLVRFGNLGGSNRGLTIVERSYVTGLQTIEESTGNAFGNLTVQPDGGNVGIGDAAPTTARLSVHGTVAATPVIIAKGAAAQSGDLQQWQNSAGSSLGYVTSAGAAVFAGVLTGGDLSLTASASRLKFGHADQAQTTVGAAGGASALPATPTKYFKVKDSGGTEYVIPAYAAA